MSLVNLTNIVVLDNPAPIQNSFKFEITIQCTGELRDDLEWKIIYVGSAESEKYDQTLETILLGPVPEGVNRFLFEAPAPDYTQIKSQDVLGATVILITCSYMEREFVRVGFFINNEYTDPELRESPPETPQLDKIHRVILEDKPRITKFPINWDNPQDEMMVFDEDSRSAMMDVRPMALQ